MTYSNKNILLAAALLLLTTIGCNTPKKMLCRTWDVVYMDFDAKQVGITPQMKGIMVKQYEDSANFTFIKDGSYYLQVPEARDTGTWTLSRKADSLYADAGTYKFVSKIARLNKDTLSLDTKTSDGLHIKFMCKPVLTPSAK